MSEKPDEQSTRTAFRMRRDSYAHILESIERLPDKIKDSQWQDEKAKLGVVTSFRVLSILASQLNSLDELTEMLVDYMHATQGMFDSLHPLVRDIAEEVERIGGNQQKLERTKTELEEIRQSIADQTKTYGELQKLVAGAVQSIEEDRKKVEKGLSYVT